MTKIYDKMFLKNNNQTKYKQLIHIIETNKRINEEEIDE